MATVIDLPTRQEAPQGERLTGHRVDPSVMEHLSDVDHRLLRLRWLAHCQRELCHSNVDACWQTTAGAAPSFDGLFTLAQVIEELLVGVGDIFEELHKAVIRSANGGRA